MDSWWSRRHHAYVMMRLWKQSYSRPAPVGGAAAASTLVHLAVVAAWVAATRPAASMAADSIANRIFYIPPPDKPARVAGSIETIHYVNLADGLGAGPGPAALDTKAPIAPPERSLTAGAKVDSAAVNTPPGNSNEQSDSVFTILEVDSAVVRSSASAAPAYPLDLLQKHIEGMVRVRYVVDTTGFADPSSLEVLESSHPEFLASVRDVLPYMRFSPAKIGSKKVRQLVEQPFSFHISAALEAKAKAKP